MNATNHANFMSRFRSRLENSRLLASLLARIAGGYLSFCNRTIKWDIEGLDDLREALADGPVLVVLWHRHSLMAATHWPVKDGPLSSPFAASPIGRVSGELQRLRGLLPIEMSDKQSNLAASRKILRRFRDGVSIGVTGDGPLGPACEMKTPPIEWASRGPMRIWVYGFDCERKRVLDTWDDMILPRPFGRGRLVFSPFEHGLPRRPTPEQSRATQSALGDFLNDLNSRLSAPYSDKA